LSDLNGYSLLIVDDHPVFVSGFIQAIKNERWLQNIYHSENGLDALKIIRQKKVDLILIDIQMPKMDGLKLLDRLSTRKKLKKIIFSSDCYPIYVEKSIRLGIDGYLTKELSIFELIPSIKKVLRGEKYFCPKAKTIVEKINKKPKEEFLTKMEQKIIQLLCQQKTNGEIASSLGLSENTVKSHRRSIKRKTKTQNVGGLIIYSLENGLFDYRK